MTAVGDGPAMARATLVTEGDDIRLTIPARRNPVLIGVLVSWAALFLAAFIDVAVNGSSAGDLAGVGLFALVAILAAGGLLTWTLRGREEVELVGSRLTTRRVLGSLHREQRFDASGVSDLRASRQGWGSFDQWTPSQLWGLTGGAVAFEYESATYRFGAGLDEREAEEFAQRLAGALSRRGPGARA
jgi:hypothetical protein